ncbi:MAG: hypothetical protein ACOYNU_12235, partial [Bacteroidales bacterium]
MRIINTWYIFLLFTLSGNMLMAQTTYLSRKVSLDIPSCSLEVALIEIGKAADFRFSYDADLIPGKRQVRVKANNTPVNSLLGEMLGKAVRPKEVGNHVILVRNGPQAREKQTFSSILLSGTIRDASDRRPMVNATVYEVENRYSAITSGDGSYKIILPSGKKIRSLSFCK